MVKIKKSVFIQAPVEKVFEFFSEPANLPEIWPSVVEVRDVQRLGDEVQGWRYVYKMAGMKFDGQTKVIERIENQRYRRLSAALGNQSAGGQTPLHPSPAV